jgi:transcriptional regulator with XRE-family HTH domain
MKIPIRIHRARIRPMKLPAKLLRIREALGLTQGELIEKMKFDESVKQQHVSAWEKGIREPDLLSLVKYAKAANVCLEVIVDDAHDLPAVIPAKKTFHPH